MLHEVLVACLGHPGNIIRDEATHQESNSSSGVGNGTFRVPDRMTFLAPTEREAINRIVGLGSVFRYLRGFVRPLPRGEISGGDSELIVEEASQCPERSPEKLYVRALKQGVEELLDEYAERVAAVERDVMKDPTLTLTRVNASLREYQAVLPAMAEFCEAAFAKSSRRAPMHPRPLLEMLYSRSQFGAPDVRCRFERLLWHCTQVLLNQIMSWVLHGLLVDPFSEFFIQQNGRGGRSREGGGRRGSRGTNPD
ncbi:unnamed protein product, partial [Choristocarpus tenellus]